ncbi:MAG: RNA-binding protein [Bacteroidetes bacterium]|jgi:ribosome-associated heat shock protein Hsp15|nr:RNA-binding protein [Bacteroidota bacterium]MBS1233887.1 RNA-binding protein [Bacteroidota bacterium]
MTASEKHRIDKFLWSVRIFKTRSLAAEACNKGRIVIEGIQVKPSRVVKVGDVILVRKLPVIYTYRVISLPDSRVSAQRVPVYITDMTSAEEISKLNVRDTVFYSREKGSGRPTKKERRTLDRILDEKG